jgi:hypothetical protein
VATVIENIRKNVPQSANIITLQFKSFIQIHKCSWEILGFKLHLSSDPAITKGTSVVAQASVAQRAKRSDVYTKKFKSLPETHAKDQLVQQ